MKFIKLENNHEILYRQPLTVDDRLVFTDDPATLAEHGFYPLHEADHPEPRAGYRTVRHLEFAGDYYNEVYEYVAIGEDDELTAEETEIIMGGGTI